MSPGLIQSANERVASTDPKLEVIFWLGLAFIALLGFVAYFYFSYKQSVGLCECPCHHRHDNWVDPNQEKLNREREEIDDVT